MRILDRYILNSVLWATGLVVLVLIGIESFIDFIGELSSIGVANYGISAVFIYVGMQIPANLYQLFPVAGFLGGLIGLSRLASTSELIIMRASGVSIARITWAVIKAALLMLVVITAIGEWQAPTLQYQAMKFKEKQTQRVLNPWSSQELWLHQGQSFVHIGSVLSSTAIKDIQRFDFDKNYHLLSSSKAASGTLQGGVWQLQQVSVTLLSPDKSEVKHYDQLPLGFSFQPELLREKMQRDPSQQTISVLWNNIRYHHQAGLLAHDLEFALWARILQPITTIIMICLGVPFIFGSLRSTSMSTRILTGIIVGFVFYMLNQFLGPIALVYQWPAWIAGALPAVFFLFIYTILLLRIK
jgi:lipopolysaccharide export system permease protein